VTKSKNFWEKGLVAGWCRGTRSVTNQRTAAGVLPPGTFSVFLSNQRRLPRYRSRPLVRHARFPNSPSASSISVTSKNKNTWWVTRVPLPSKTRVWKSQVPDQTRGPNAKFTTSRAGGASRLHLQMRRHPGEHSRATASASASASAPPLPLLRPLLRRAAHC
jgi:hypothetical protein